jgi:hypothetical protein
VTAPTRRPQARQLLTPQSERILATRYPGQVRAVVIERALRRMAAADERRARKAARAEEGMP